MSNSQSTKQTQDISNVAGESVNDTQVFDKKDVFRFIASHKYITIPLLQKQFALTYLTAKNIVDELLIIDFIRYVGDLTYKIIPKKRSQSEEVAPVISNTNEYNLDEESNDDDDDAKKTLSLTKKYIGIISNSLYGSVEVKEFGILTIQDFDGGEEFVFEFRTNKTGYYLVNINNKPMRQRLRTAKYAKFIEQYDNVKLYGNRIWVEFSDITQLLPAILKLHSLVKVVQSGIL
ncbi:MAG: hypothetical protein ACI4MY_04865 [Christensenellales bacterium]